MTNASTTLSIPEKLDRLEDVMNGKVYERQREIRTGIVAIVAKKHHLQVGPPGVAKTMLVDEIVKLIGGLDDHYFRWLMTRFTTPPEVFGPPSLKALENDIYRVNTTHKLPEAYIAFLDEFFKCNSALLNSFLTVMNEGLFFNNGTPIQLQLGTIFAGSNELPREPELAALWDRVTFRHEVKPIRERANRLRMFKARVAQRQAQATVIDPVITWDEILIAQDMAAKVDMPDVVLEKLDELVSNLQREGIEPTERRQNDCIQIIQATAYRSGRTVADVDDMRLLRHVLWMDLKDQPVVDRLVLELANPLDKEAMDLLDTVEKLAGDVSQLLKNTDNKQQRRRQGIEIHGKLERCGEDLDKLYEQAKKSPRRSEMIDEARTRLGSVVGTLLKELFDIEEGSI